MKVEQGQSALLTGGGGGIGMFPFLELLEPHLPPQSTNYAFVNHIGVFLAMVCAGRALAVALAGRGVRLTILDLNIAHGEETVRLVEEEHAKISYKPIDSPSAIFIRCDVANSGNSHYPLLSLLQQP